MNLKEEEEYHSNMLRRKTGVVDLDGDLLKESDDDYWNTRQRGHTFEDSDLSSSSNQFSISTFEANKPRNCSVSKPEPKQVSRPSFEISSAPAPSFEEQKEEDILQININLCAIRPKVKFKEVEKASAYLTVRSMVLGMECDLSPFKTLNDKQKLLSAACFFHDGNAILKIVIFLRNTLKKSVFQREIKQYPAAVNMYLSYLRELHQINELEDMLWLLQRFTDLALLKYEHANVIRDPQRKLKVLLNMANTYCQPGVVHRFITESINEHCKCIEDYKVLMDHKVVSDMRDDHVFETVIGRKEITDSCAVHTMVFSLLHFYNVAEIASISAYTLRRRYRIKSRKYHWCILATLSAAQSYDNLEKMFLIRKFFGGTKIQSHVPYQTFLDVLYRSNPPIEVMERFCAAIDSGKKDKLALAQKYHCNSVIIEILKKNRSRSALIEFQNTLSPDSADYKIISAALTSSDIKWKP